MSRMWLIVVGQGTMGLNHISGGVCVGLNGSVVCPRCGVPQPANSNLICARCVQVWFARYGLDLDWTQELQGLRSPSWNDRL